MDLRVRPQRRAVRVQGAGGPRLGLGPPEEDRRGQQHRSRPVHPPPTRLSGRLSPPARDSERVPPDALSATATTCTSHTPGPAYPRSAQRRACRARHRLGIEEGGACLAVGPRRRRDSAARATSSPTSWPRLPRLPPGPGYRRGRATEYYRLAHGCERLDDQLADARVGRGRGVWRRAIGGPAAPASVQRQQRRADCSYPCNRAASSAAGPRRGECSFARDAALR